jgi:hypothetical protein
MISQGLHAGVHRLFGRIELGSESISAATKSEGSIGAER